MKGYSKKQGQKLQRKVLQSLLAASVMCVCTFGGDVSECEAYVPTNIDAKESVDSVIQKETLVVESDGTDSKNKDVGLWVKNNGKLTIDKILSVNMKDGNIDNVQFGSAIYNDGGTISVGEGVKISIKHKNYPYDDVDDLYQSGLEQKGGSINFGENSEIIIDADWNDSRGISIVESKKNSITGNNLVIAINQNNAESLEASWKNYGIYAENSKDTMIKFENVDISVVSGKGGASWGAEAEGLHLQETAMDIDTKVMQISVKSDTLSRGIHADGGTNKINVNGTTNITADATEKAEGISSEGGAESTFGTTIVNVASKKEATGIISWGNNTKNTFSKATQLAVTSDEVATGISAGDGAENVFTDATVLSVQGKESAIGINTEDVAENTFGDTVLDVRSEKGDVYGVKGDSASTTVFNKDLSIALQAAADKHTVALQADNNAVIEINKNTTGVVKISGDISSNKGGKIEAVFNSADSFLSGSSSKDGNSTVNLAFGDNAKWNMTGDSQVTDLTVGKGTVIDMSGDKGANSTLTVDNLKGSGADFIMDVNKDGHDALIVKGASAAGDHSVSLNVNGIDALKNLAASDEAFISTDNADTKFNIADGFSGGLYEYSADLKSEIGADGKIQWYVASTQSRIGDTFKTMAGTNQVAYTAWIDGNGTLRQRVGELQNGAESGVWARMFGGKLGGDDFTNKYKTYQLGYDAKAGDWRVGAAYEYSDGSLNYTSGSGENKIGAVSLYGTLQGKDNSALDIVIKRGRIYGDMDLYGKYSDKGDYATDATSIGVEYTKRFDGGNKVYFEPQAQLTFGRIDGYDYVSAKGVKVAYDDINSLIGRLGIVAGKSFGSGEAYFKASVLHEFCGDSSVTMLAANGDSYKADQDYGDTWLEVGIGGNIALGKNCELYGDVERSFGGDVTKNWGANIGFRYSF